MVRATFLYIAILFFVNTSAQTNNYSLKFTQNFKTKSKGLYTSNSFKINNTNTYQFATLSAYGSNLVTAIKINYRVFSNKQWSAWLPLKEDKETRGNQRTVFGLQPIFSKFNKIQFQSNKKLSQTITFRILFLQENNASDTRNKPDKNILNCDLPNSCDRSCWCPSGNCDPQSSPYAIDVTHVIVHHSATNYSSGTDYAQVVYSYWDYHVNTHGWNDIGYNWLVDSNGILYEGRGDGIQGAHFSCMNGQTMGVCMIGNFETATPTTEAISTLESIVAWEVTDKDIDVLANTYHPSSQLNLYTVSGHKDGNPSPVGCPSGTLCPGTNLYSELASIRTDISGFPCYVSASIDEINSDTTVKVYPNPVTSILSIENLTNQPFHEISIFNTSGVQIAVFSYDLKTIDLTKYSTGIYFIRIKRKDNKTLFYKVIKQ